MIKSISPPRNRETRNAEEEEVTEEMSMGFPFAAVHLADAESAFDAAHCQRLHRHRDAFFIREPDKNPSTCLFQHVVCDLSKHGAHCSLEDDSE